MTLLIVVLNSGTSYSQEVPKVHISNGIIECEIYLPDAENGYYRGTRFDWAGVVSSLEYKNHTYFGKWFKKYEPTIHDVIMGPVEAFDPIGYDSAKPGETFVKIGVGILERPDTAKYHFSRSYKILDNGVWNFEIKKDKVDFAQQIVEGEYPYTYKKSIRLKDNKMMVEHTLINNGDSTIKTNVFNHNFFVIDKQNTGPGVTITFPFTIEGDKSRLGEFAEIVNGNQIKFVKELETKDHPMIVELQGFGSSNKDYNIRVENKNSKAGVRITCDRPLSNVVFWSAIKTVSPEPYIDINVKGAESFSWTITYEFYTL
ncbi:MAG: hypothetical protein COC08_02730 [Maribacter sp.]|nr:MAG: hypothetical protein COC08_02730 [Maribacter sp.]